MPPRPTSPISRRCARAPDKGKIIATTLDYPMVMDTFGCTPKFIAENEAAVKALTKSYFEALAMIKADEKKAYEIMGADVKQTGEAFGNSAKYLRWQDQDANKKFFSGRARGLLEGGRGPAPGDRGDQGDPGSVEARRSQIRAVITCLSPRATGRERWQAYRERGG